MLNQINPRNDKFVKRANCFVLVSIYFSKVIKMNNNAYIVSGIIAFVFLVMKFVEMRLTSHKSDEEDESATQPKPLKFLIRDALLVYLSSLTGFYIIAQFEEHSASGGGSAVKEVAAFTGGPDF